MLATLDVPGPHTLPKRWARNVYDAAGKDIMIFQDALGRTDIGASQRHLDVGRDRVLEVASKPVVRTNARRSAGSLAGIRPMRILPSDPGRAG